MTDRGIDYGLGKHNIDKETGIRFGVIHQNNLFEWFYEQLEYEYGDPCCPKCGAEGITPITELSDDISFETDFTKDYACEECKECFGSDECFPEEPICLYIDDGEYKAFVDELGDVFIEKAPFYTKAQFCSPCAPGACYLTNPTDEGEKAYCFGHDWFQDDVAPYPVYSVETDELVLPEVKKNA